MTQVILAQGGLTAKRLDVVVPARKGKEAGSLEGRQEGLMLSLAQVIA